jgi:prepilin-type N-terminal cleavage/methylation domain-containing protein
MTDHFFPVREQSRRGQGFTLVEMLVAMAVLSILAVLLAQVVALTSQATAAASKHLDATGQARVVFDRLATDLAGRPNRSDLGMLFTKVTPGNDSFQFYTQANGYSGARQVTAVGYRIQQTTAGRLYQLERGAAGTDWTGNTNPLVQFLPNVFAAPAVSDANYDVLANDVFRLEFCFLLNTGLLSTTSASPYNSAGLQTYSDVVGLVVGLGVLDGRSRELISSTNPNGPLATLCKDLADPPSGQDPASYWSTAMAQPGFGAGLPLPVVQNIRIYQRTFYVQ